jgi:hypothetical protein
MANQYECKPIWQDEGVELFIHSVKDRPSDRENFEDIWSEVSVVCDENLPL